MMQFLKTLFVKPAPKEPTHIGDMLILKHDKDGRGLCPACGSRDLRSGPVGGMCVNAACGECFHEFNLVSLGGHIAIEESRGIMHPNRARVFGIVMEHKVLEQ